MISGGSIGIGVAVLETQHSTLHGVRKTDSSFLNPGSLSAHCTVANGGNHESLSSPVLRDTVQSASDLSYVLQHQYLSLKREGGVQGWRTRDISVSRGVPVSMRGPIREIAEAIGASEETISVQGDRIGNSGSFETSGFEDNGSLPEEGDSSTLFKLNPAERFKDFARQAKILKEEVTSMDYTVSPTPFSPVEGAEAVKFGLICVGLVFVFWLGNYYVPDQIFKATVFKREAKDPFDPIDTTSEDSSYLPMSNQNSPKGSTEASKISEDDAVSSAITSGAGFAERKKQNRAKSGKRK